MNDKETLEEAAENYAIDKQNENASKYYMALESFQEGAKWQQEQEKITTDDAYNEGFENGKHWQQERSYSEEEVLSLLFKYGYNLLDKDAPFTGDTTDEWFEQFKKK